MTGIDKERVVRALRLCCGDALQCEQESCPYWDKRLCITDLHIDAVDLLTEDDDGKSA